jgi:hypothetical protein
MPKVQTTKPATLTIRVGPVTRSEIERYAKFREMSTGEFVRYCIRVYMDSIDAEDV